MTDSNKWYTQSGPDGDVVLSTRIRLARNFSDIPFVGRMTDAQKAQVEERVRDAVLNGNSTLAGSFHYIHKERQARRCCCWRMSRFPSWSTKRTTYAFR